MDRNVTSRKSSFLFRTVALELAHQDEEEVLGILHDVQGFLKRPEGLPSYISKSDLFTELVKIWKNPSVDPEKKAEAIDTSGLLLKAISGKRIRKKNSHSSADLSKCLDIVLPPAICQLTSKEPQIQNASLRYVCKVRQMGTHLNAIVIGLFQINPTMLAR